MGSFIRLAGVVLFVSYAGSAVAQNPHLNLRKNHYELRAGEPVPLEADDETVNFLLNARSRTIEVDGQPASGLTAGPNAAKDKIVMAASIRIKPGSHRIRISAVSDSGEQREATLDVVQSSLPTVPSGSSRAPVVLLNGWLTGYTGACPVAVSSADTFGNLAQYLISDGVPAVYLFDNCLEDPNQSIETLGNDLGLFLNAIHYDNGNQVPQIDLVAHSMGGLIARAYLAGLQPQAGVVLTPPTPTLVHDLVLIATPNFGSFVAATYASVLTTTAQSEEMIPGSDFLWNLNTWNQRTDDLRGVNAIAVVGNAGNYNTSVANAADGLVSLTSASLGFVAQTTATTRIVPYCHVDPIAFINSLLGSFYCSSPGIANVTDTNQLTGQIVRSFLAGNNNWMSIGSSPSSDPYLSKDGGTFFTLMNAAGNYYTDLTSVTWGTIQMTPGPDTGTIYYDDLVSGTGGLTAVSQSMGTASCGNLAQMIGYVVPTRCKYGPTLVSVTPLASGSGRVVASGASLTLNGLSGSGFGNSQCGSCKVILTPPNAGAQTLNVTSWTNTAIKVNLPASFTGFGTLTMTAATGGDSINIVAAPATAVLAAAPATLQFTYAVSGATPAAQTVAISNSGTGALNWSAADSDSWVVLSPATGTAPSNLSVSVNPQGLAPGTYQSSVQISASGATGSPATIAVTLVVQTATGPNIAAVVNTASFQPGLASATWISIFGTNLSSVTDSWQAGSFVNGALPTSLDGVSVTINNIPAYISYVSPTQINVLAPDDATTGAVQVQVTASQQQSNSVNVQKAQFAPAFFMLGSGPYVVAQHADYSLVGSPNLIPGVATAPATPGEVIQLYATGLGPANPAVPTSQLVTSPTMLANTVQVTIGGVAANVAFAGLVGSGLYQVNVTVPALANGDAPIVATVSGIQTQTGALVTIQN